MTGLASRAGRAIAALMISGALLSSAQAEDGVSKDKILFGQAAALEGPASALGLGMQLGLNAAFGEANRAGGVNGRKIDLISMNDGYEPELSISAVKELINNKKVFALVGPVGTPTAKATQPIATEARVPFVGPFTGAGFLRNADLGNVVNVRATYGAETEAWIRYLMDEKGMQRIALLYQDDAFGRVGLDGVTAALKKRGKALVATGTFTRNTVAVKTALINIRRSKPDAVVMVGTYKPMATFIKVARSIDFNPVFMNISFVGSGALARELGAAGDGVMISQVVPFPWDTSIPLVRRYHAALKAHDPKAKPEFISFEGYMVGRLVVMALEKCGDDVTRKKFLETIWSTGVFDLDGTRLTYGPKDNQGMDQVFLTVINSDGSFRSIGAAAM